MTQESATTTRRTATLLVVALALVAGCSGFLADDASQSSPATDGAGVETTASPDDGTPDGTGTAAPDTGATAAATAAPDVRTRSDEHPYVSGGSLDVSALLRTHLEALGRAESFRLTNNGTARYVSNGTQVARFTDVRRFGLSARRASILRRSTATDGTVQGLSARFVNASATCTRTGDEARCGQGGFERQRALGLTVETTSLETLAGPAFAPNGTVERDGRSLYRYTATELRSSLDEDTRAELGPDPSLRSSTLLVAPDGRVVEYRFAVERGDGEGTRVLLERTYRTRAVNATTVRRPSWLPS